jgi:non-ribosomal peptide synthetase-like protein
VISRWSLAYIRVVLKTGIVESAGNWLSGTLFWPAWLRLAGMRVGRGCEISTIIDVVPELIDIGDWSFLADGIYLGGPHVHRGTVSLAPTRLGANSFVGNHAVIAGGEQLPDDVLIGISTPSARAAVTSGSSWFGSPPFALPRRAPEHDRRLTHDPSAVRYGTRVFWEVLRVTLPVGPLLGLVAWFEALALLGQSFEGPVFLLGVVPVVSGAVGLALCVVVLALKWILLGRVRPGIHPLWSCWCSRWDFLYVVWRMYARGALSAFEGTALLPWYLRAMGMRIGRGVVLGPGFAQVVDPDMLTFDDGATVACAFQAHTFEDRVLKIDRVAIGAHATVGTGAVLLYGADIGAGARVAPQSVVMKKERLLPGHSYEGCPTRAVD